MEGWRVIAKSKTPISQMFEKRTPYLFPPYIAFWAKPPISLHSNGTWAPMPCPLTYTGQEMEQEGQKQGFVVGSTTHHCRQNG